MMTSSTHAGDGSRTRAAPECEAFAFNHPGVMATSRKELLHMLATTSLDAKTARPAVVLTGTERYEQGHERYLAWLAGIAAFNAGNAPAPESLAVPSYLSTVANDDEPGPVVPFRKRRKPAPAPV